MPRLNLGFKNRLYLFALFAGLTAPLGVARAHCDAMNGPVVQAAQEALESGDFSTIAIWVGEQQTDELRQKFEQTRAVYQLGEKPQELAKDYFYEVAVRLHRQAEGMCYEGLRPARPLPKDLAVAEEALDKGSPEAVVALLSQRVQQKVNRLLNEVVAAEKKKNQSIEAGREWVDAYVRYVTFVHGLDQAIEAGPEHGLGPHEE